MNASERTVVLDQEEFEELARLGRRMNEALRLESVHGRIHEKLLEDGTHSTIAGWLTRRCRQADSRWWLHHRRPLRAGARGRDNVIPDGSLTHADAFCDGGMWSPPGRVLMTVEITTGDEATDHRIRQVKPGLYAETGIPVHLRVDRANRETIVQSEPHGAATGRSSPSPSARPSPFPEHVGFVLGTGLVKGPGQSRGAVGRWSADVR